VPICQISVEPAGCQHKKARPAAIWQTVEILQQAATRNQQIRKSKSIRRPWCYRHLAVFFGYGQEHLNQSILVLYMQIQLLTPF